MKLVIQRVKEASVKVDETQLSSIGQGMLVFVGFTHSDTPEVALRLAKKLVALRIFSDAQKPINASIADSDGQILLVSQFTLYASTQKGNRPSFLAAMPPEQAEPLFESFVAMVRELWPKVATGKFGAQMEISLINEGPTTIVLEL